MCRDLGASEQERMVLGPCGGWFGAGSLPWGSSAAIGGGGLLVFSYAACDSLRGVLENTLCVFRFDLQHFTIVLYALGFLLAAIDRCGFARFLRVLFSCHHECDA